MSRAMILAVCAVFMLGGCSSGRPNLINTIYDEPPGDLTLPPGAVTSTPGVFQPADRLATDPDTAFYRDQPASSGYKPFGRY